MAKVTLGGEFRRLRESKGVLQREIAEACDLSMTVPWKVENGRTVRWATIHSMLTAGLRCQPGTADYQNIHALWLADNQERANAAAPEKGKKAVPPHVTTAVNSFRALVRELPEKEVRKILAAAKREAVKLAK